MPRLASASAYGSLTADMSANAPCAFTVSASAPGLLAPAAPPAAPAVPPAAPAALPGAPAAPASPPTMPTSPPVSEPAPAALTLVGDLDGTSNDISSSSTANTARGP